MRRSIGLIVILLAFATGCNVPPPDTVKPGTLTGVVTGPNGPVVGANVSVTPSDNSYHVGQTDSQGYYIITGIPPGSVVVSISAPGYQTYNASVMIPANGTVTQNASLSQS